MNRTRVLHIASHLGGGVGRVLSALAAFNRKQEDGVEDVFICLEKPRDARFADKIAACGATLFIEPDEAVIRREIEAADIVQVEWWHHPLMAKALCRFGGIPARWVVWAHTSGLHYPIIHPDFVNLPQAFIATTTATMPLLRGAKTITECIHSSGDFDDFPMHKINEGQSVRCGYLGSLNPAKLHPEIVRYLKEVGRPDFKVDFYGDSSVNPELEAEARAEGSPVRLRGFCEKPESVLPDLDIFIYLLNPLHYGTTENALLEAMACGAVPIVMNNPVELGIVENGATGIVVSSPEDFAARVRFLLDHPDDLKEMSDACMQTVRKSYLLSESSKKFAGLYRKVLAAEKRSVDFTAAFGKTPFAWFLSCLGSYAECFAAGGAREKRLGLPFLYEKSKASVFQYQSYFPEDSRLAEWASMLQKDREKV